MPEDVTLVIPGRNCAGTIRACLDAVAPLKQAGALRQILFVDDGSTDATSEIVARFDVRVVRGEGRGAATARNLGWRAAETPLVWFIDSDCVAEPDALDKLLPHLDDPKVGAVGGSYTNRNPDSLLACLIHEEIIERHRAMPQSVDFLAGFNVVYRRAVLERFGGFDERYPAATAEDADMSFRVLKAGYALRFDSASRVGHFHETRWGRYLRTQQRHGYWRVRLHTTHRGEAVRNAYSGWLDHVQPPLAMLALVAMVLAIAGGAVRSLDLLPGSWRFAGWMLWAAAAMLLLLAAAQLPMTVRLVRRLRSVKYVWYAPLGFLRAFRRGLGLTHGLLSAIFTGRG